MEGSTLEILLGAAFIVCALLAAIYSSTNMSKVIVLCTLLLILTSIMIYEEIKGDYLDSNTIENVPTCAEDEIITGVGDFGPDGYWEEYKCENTEIVFCQTLYHVLEIRGPYLNNPPLTGEQIELINQINGWYSCGFE